LKQQTNSDANKQKLLRGKYHVKFYMFQSYHLYTSCIETSGYVETNKSETSQGS